MVKQTTKELGYQTLGSVVPIFILAFIVFLYRTTNYSDIQSNVNPGIVPVAIGFLSLITCFLGLIIETLLPEKEYNLKQWFVVGVSYSSILAILLNPYAGALLFAMFNPVTVRLMYGSISNNEL